MNLALRSLFSFALLLTATATLPACGGSGGSSTALYGTLSVSLTDGPSDKLDSFRVKVTSIDIHKSNSTVIHALASPVMVDLADLTETGELLNSLTASMGAYTSVTVTLDMSTAICLLAGQSTPATIKDDQGGSFAAPITVPVAIPGFLSLPGAGHKLIELDLDLAQSLLIDTTNNEVEFTPAFFVRTVLAQQKPVAIAGTLVSVDTPNSTFVLDLKDDNGAAIDSVTCIGDNATVFQIDGTPSTGMTGINALALLAPGTWVQAQGTIDPAAATVLVSNVNAGTGTWNGGTDIVEGVVIDRVGGAGADATLTVLGRSSNSAHTVFQYDTSFTVTTALATTHVVRHASATAYDTDELNVGQQVRVFGTLTGANMDASLGVVREQPTWIYGAAAGAPASGQITLSLVSVGLRDQSLFNWTANPASFLTDVGTLADALTIGNGTNVLERGFFAPVSGGATDFTADRVVDADTAPSLVLVRNRLATGFSVTLTCTTGQIDISIAGSAATGEFALLDQGFVGVSNLPSNPTPDIVPAGLGLYTLRDLSAGTIQIYTYFPSFSAAVGNAVGMGAEVRHVGAVGDWNGVTNTLQSGVVSIVVQ